MTGKHAMEIQKDLPNKRLHIQRKFDAARKAVWQAWTTPEILDQWWAPHPYRAETRTLDFRVGGKWVYAMVGPDNTRMWCRVDYTKIQAQDFFEGNDAFCDENEVINTEFPSMHWKTAFSEENGVTTVFVTVSFDSEADLNKIIEMGFETGFAAGLSNLENYLQAKIQSLPS